MKSLYVFVLTACMLALSCTSSIKKADAQREGCSYNMTVIDMTGLDGCRLMLQDEQGARYQPIGFPEGGMGYENLSEGMKLKIGYEEETGMAGICMSGKMIRITCIEKQ